MLDHETAYVQMAERAFKKIEALSGLLEIHRCNADPGKTVGECVKRGLCGCSCGLLIEPEKP